MRRRNFPQSHNVPTVLDLFCGAGGLTLGAARAGFHVVGGIDFDKRALASHIRNFPEAQHAQLNLAGTTGAAILEELGLQSGSVDVVTGGPPCQGFSSIGKRDEDDPRNLLIVEFAHLVTQLKPQAFVLENVPGLLSTCHSETLSGVTNILERSYNVLSPHELRATDAGAPTVRTRVFIVGFRNKSVDGPNFWREQEEKLNAPVVRQALDGLPFDIQSDWKNSWNGKRTVRIARQGTFFASAGGRIPRGVGDKRALDEFTRFGLVTGCLGTRHSKELERRYSALKYGQSDSKTKSTRLDPNGYCPTLRAGTGPDKGSFQAVRPIHYCRPRVITPREAARLQGFPDWFQFDQTKWHSFRQIGNSVSPLAAEFVLNKVFKLIST
jgi:DNA (cytosine-5)-methyltransferase 1